MPPTLEEKLTQLQLMSAPAFLATWEERHPAERGRVREVLEALVDRELTRRREQQVAARIKAAHSVSFADCFAAATCAPALATSSPAASNSWRCTARMAFADMRMTSREVFRASSRALFFSSSSARMSSAIFFRFSKCVPRADKSCVLKVECRMLDGSGE